MFDSCNSFFTVPIATQSNGGEFFPFTNKLPERRSVSPLKPVVPKLILIRSTPSNCDPKNHYMFFNPEQARKEQIQRNIRRVRQKEQDAQFPNLELISNKGEILIKQSPKRPTTKRIRLSDLGL